MSIEPKTESEKIRELDEKIHSLKMGKLLKIEYITTQTKIVVEALATLDVDLKTAYDRLTAEGEMKMTEVKRLEAIIKCVKARKEVLTGFKQVLHECRLSLTLLMKEENQLTLRKLELKTGVG